MSTQILWYDEQEHQKGVLTYDSAIHEEDLDGADKLTVVTRRNAAKRDRLVWQDNAGYWHEHIIDAVSTTHHGGTKRHTLTCSNSISELFRIEAPGKKAKKRVSEHLADICAGTRWNAGNSSGTVVEIETWHKNVRECMTELCAQCGGELVTHINVDDNGVISRTVRIVADYGTKIVKRTFTYGHNMGAVKREVAADEVYTAVRGYGAKTAETAWQAHIDELEEQYEESTDTDERKKLQKRIAAAREKLKAVQDDDYAERLMVEVKKGDKKRNRWGMFNGLAMQHSWYIYTDNNCTDRQFLRRQCNALLKSLCNPLVRYEFDTAEVDSEMWHDVRLGSKVLCVDPVFEGGAAIERVSHIKRNLSGTMRCRIAIGKRANPQIDQYKTTQRLSKITTGNGVKTQSYTPTSSGGNYSGVGGYSPIGQYEVDGETFTIGDGNQPAAIQVVTPPNKTEYFIGAPIDYTGIVVQLLDGESNVFTSDAYPDGIIPFDELEFPVETAEIDSGEFVAFLSTSDLEIPEWEQPIKSFRSVFLASMGVGGNSHLRTEQRFVFNEDAVIIFTRNTDQSMRYCIASSKYNTTVDIASKTIDTRTGEETSSSYRTFSTASHSYTHNGKTVYYMQGTYGMYGGRYIEYEPKIDEGINTSPTRECAWTAIYGNKTSSATVSVPVEWNELSDSFDITAINDYLEYSTTAFKSTGGGRF